MSTLTYADRALVATEKVASKPARKPFWTRLLDAIVRSQQRRADREIARILANRGHLLTDDTEREIMRGLQKGNTWLG